MKNYISDQFSLGKLTDLERMLQTYGDKANEALYYFSNKNTELANKSLDEAAEINSLIIDRYGYYAAILNKATEDRRLDLLTLKKAQNVIDLMIIAGLVIFCTFFAGIFTKSVTKPVRQLAASAEQISKGDFNISQIQVKSNDEISLLSSVYYKMVQSIKYYIKEIELKAELQQRLMDEENKNLRNEALLRQTQLNALQAKINPHFLFNTLNMIKQTAFLENAQETRVMLETTSQLLRFYLDKAGTEVSLKEEIENVANYIYIQNKRIGKRIKFDMVIDDDVSNIRIPGLIIQPLLENSIIHGLDDCIRDGQIVVVEGQMAAKWINEKLGGKAEVGVLNYRLGSVLINREDGMREALEAECPGAQIVAVGQADNPTDGMKVTENFLQAHPNIKVILCVNDAGALGAVEAAKALGKASDDFAVFGADSAPEALAKIKEGSALRGTVYIFPEELPGIIMDTSIKLAYGETVDKEIVGRIAPVTNENYDEIIKQ